MRRKISLKWFMALSFLALAFLLIVGYSYLSVRFFFRGMDNVIADNMVHALESYIDTIPGKQRQQLNRFSGYLICRQWQDMPEEIRRAIDPPVQPGELLVSEKKEWFSPPQKIFFTMFVSHKGEAFYITHMATRQKASPLIGRNKEKNLEFLMGISLVTTLGILTVIWILLRQVERPVKALGQWAHDLNSENLQAPLPDFFYPELNELAGLIQTSLSSVQESLDREHRFLRYSSHELRTPISVIRNNVELLRKYRQTAQKQVGAAPGKHVFPEQQEKVIDRIDRASLTMKHLTETLLWLSREKEAHLPAEETNLEQLVRELVSEAQYLLKDKDVEVVLETTTAVIVAPGDPVRIVTGNLIRNAFQHSWRGKVRIIQSQDHVETINDILETDDSRRDLGFGLGLQLTRQLCEKLNWSYTSRTTANQHSARVVFNVRKSS